jgi:hypothetical protein
MTDRSLCDARYRVVFTPVGWQVVDTYESRDPVAEFGLGDTEYRRAQEEATRKNVHRWITERPGGYEVCANCGESRRV